MKYVYNFKEGHKNMRDILGGKGANLCEMTRLGLPIPSGLIISTDACKAYYENNETLDTRLEKQIYKKLTELETKTGKKFGDLSNPLLISVRSGAPVSMPGMMDTILNLGLNDEIVNSLSKILNARFVYDCYRRFIAMYADVVMKVDKNIFEDIMTNAKKEKGVKYDQELEEKELKKIVSAFKKAYKKATKKDFPQDVKEQLMTSVVAVFKSWNNERAVYYRKINNIPNNIYTAVNIQEMVYGNVGGHSLTGVCFSRNPATGDNTLYGEYLMNAQGEDIVAGVRTPSNIAKLEQEMPEVYHQLETIAKKLEKHYLDIQDIEFTVQNDKLYILQTRNGKRTPRAALKIVIDLVKEKMISKKEAILRVNPNEINQLLHKSFDEEKLKKAKILTQGISASTGAATGKICFSSKELAELSKTEKNLILVRNETSAEDIEGMNKASGVLTVRGGMTSHAAVVARGMGVCCVTGCSDIKVNETKKELITKDNKHLKAGDYISIDGDTGIVYEGQIEAEEKVISKEYDIFMKWVDNIKRLEVRANADTKEDAHLAKIMGATGIGLCRTEHMFFNEKRILAFRKLILSTAEKEREKALKELIKYQKQDFKDLFSEMDDLKVTIRLLDPPLHEFLPKEAKEQKQLAEALKIEVKEVKQRIEEIKEINPMMGLRGCRLLITYPEIIKMQTRAIIEAALESKKEGSKVTPEIMIPLINSVEEFKYIKNIIDEEANTIFEEKNKKIKYLVGTMIETPRAALLADKLAKEVEFISFGTNDLTQLTYGYSRDDSAKFLNNYYDKEIHSQDPFKVLDKDGVGLLIKHAVIRTKETNKKIEMGVCGEHAADKYSVEILDSLKINYLSCSPYRIPVARLVAAQAVINSQTL